MRTVEQIQAYIANARVSLADYWGVYNQMEADGEPNTRFLERKTGIIKLYINTIQSFIDNKPEDVEQINKLFNSLLSYLPSSFLGLSYVFFNPLATGIAGDIIVGAVVKATESIYGIVRLSYPSININDPIVVSNSDPRITQWDAAYTLSNELYDERITAVSVNSAGNIVITKADATEFTSPQSLILNQYTSAQSASIWISGNAKVEGDIVAAGLANTGQQPLVLVADANGLLKKRTLEEFKVDVGSGVRTVAGTANQVLVNGGTAAQDGNVTLSLPQDIGTSSIPTFRGLSVVGTFDRFISTDSTNGGAKGYNFSANGTTVWNLVSSAVADNFSIDRYVSGVLAGSALTISRSTGNAVFSNTLTASSFIRAGGLSTQFLKADGSVDSNTYLTGNQTITLSGEASGSGATSIAVTLSNSAVIGKLLTGYVSGAGVVSSTDSILTAIQKLDGNISGLVTGVSSVFGRTGAVTAQSGDYTTAQVTESGNLYFTNARARASISETITGIDYDSNTGVFSLTAGYVIPTTTSAANWDTAYANRITSLTTTGSSGAATLISNVLNIPNYTLAGLGGVPYTGATTNVDLGEYGIKAGYFAYDTTPTSIPTAQGSTYWDAAEETIEIIMNGAKQHIGLDTFYNVKNSTGVTIPKGTAVRFAGTDGGSGHLLIAPFLANGTYPSTYYMGITAEDIASGDFGKVMQFGKLRGINTSAFTNGDILYASTTVAGGFQTTAPVAPNNIVVVAAVVNASSNGTLMVRATLGSNINNDEGVKITSPATGQLLQLQASGLWENKTLATILGGTSAQFVKGDGSLDSNVYLTGNQTITLSGEASGSGATSINVTLANSAVISKVLTGLSITGGAITASDTILSAFGKVQNQINGLMGGVIYKGTYNASTNTPTLSDGTGTQGWYYVVSVAGTQNFGSGNISFNIGDWAIYNGSIWEKVDNTDSVTSVNGQIGAVVLTTSDITEGTNLYYTNARARAAISETITGIDYDNGTGVFSLTSGYVIPTTTSASNWDTAYTNRITSLTTTGNSGSATLTSNTLNIPTYTLAGLGGQPLATNLTSLSGLTYSALSFVKMTAAGTFALDTNTYLTSTTGVTTIAGTANQVLVNGGTSAVSGAVTLTLPQSIATTSSPTFAALTITGNLTVDTNTLFVDATNNRVNIGSAAGGTAVIPTNNKLYLQGAGGSGTAIQNRIDIGFNDNPTFSAFIGVENPDFSNTILVLGTQGSGSSTSAVWIRNGNTQIGSRTPTAGAEKLQVTGSASISSTLLVSGNTTIDAVLRIRNSASDTWASSANDGLALQGSGTANFISTISTYLDNSSIRIGAGVTQKTGLFINGQTATGGSYVSISAAGSERFRANSTGVSVTGALNVSTSAVIGTTLTLTVTPTTSAGSFDLITRNTSTGVLEKVASNYYATAGSISGTTGRLAKFTSSGAVGDSIVSEASGSIGVGIVPSAWDNTLVNAIQLANNGASVSSYSTGNTSGKFLILSNNLYYDNLGAKFSTNGASAQYAIANNEHQWYDGGTGTVGGAISYTLTMKLTSTQLTTFGATGSEAHIFGGSVRANGSLVVANTGANYSAINTGAFSNFGLPAVTNVNLAIGVSGVGSLGSIIQSRDNVSPWYLSLNPFGGKIITANATDTGEHFIVGGSARVNGILTTTDYASFTRQSKTLLLNPNYGLSDTHAQIQSGVGMALRLATDGDNDRVVITSSGNVGIGTTTPNFTAANRTVLDVNGSLSSIIGLSNGGATNGFMYADSGNLSFGTTQNIPFLFSTNNIERMRITNDGNVGIGTISPNFTSAGRTVVDINGTTQSLLSLSRAGSPSAYLFSSSTGLELNAVGALPIFFSNNNAIRMTVNSNGYVGINSTSPARRLDIVGNHTSTTFRLYYPDLDVPNQDASIDMWASEPGVTYNGSGIGSNVNGHPYYGRTNSTLGQAFIRFINGVTAFHNLNGDAVNAERMRIAFTGNVLIGTSTDAGYKLDVNGSIRTQTGYIRGESADADITIDSSVGSRLRYGAQSFTANSVEAYISTASTLRFYIGNTGNVGIGTTSVSSAQFNISTTNLGTSASDYIGTELFYTSSGNNNYIESGLLRTSAGSDWTTAGYRIQQRVDATWMGFMQFNGTNNQGGISFGTGTSASGRDAISTRMIITSAGSVGIGTTNPLFAIHSYESSATGRVTMTENGGTGTFAYAANGVSATGGVYGSMTAWGTGSVRAGTVWVQTVNAIPLVFGTDDTERGRFTAGGNLLIGTATDSGYKLYVNGTFRSNALWTESTSVSYWGAHPSAYGGLTWDTGYAQVFATTGNQLRLVAGTAYAVIHPDGNVGINTTNPLSTLHVNGTVRTVLTSGVGGQNLLGAINGVSNGYVINVDTSNNITHTWHTGANNPSMHINASGSVGINTNNPTEKLTIRSGNIKLYSLQNAAGEYVYIGTEYDASNGNNRAEIRFGIDGVDTKTKLTFHTTNTSGALYERMVIDNLGNVGIGTASPIDILHLKSASPIIRLEKTGILNWTLGNLSGNDFGITVDNVVGTAFSLASNTGAATFSSSVSMGALTVRGSGNTIVDSVNTFGLSVGASSLTPNYVAIGTSGTGVPQINGYNNAFSSTAPLALQPNGSNVLIGTTTDDGVNKLQVSGSARVNGNLNVVGNNVNNYGISSSTFGLDSIGLTKIANGLLFRLGAISGVTNGFTSQLNASNDAVIYSFDYGNVLIGTTTDVGNKLQINGTSRFNDTMYFGSTTQGIISWGSGDFVIRAYNSNDIGFYNTAGSLLAEFGNGGDSYFTGSVGVKNATPTYDLDVTGVIRATSDVRVGGKVYIGTNGAYIEEVLVGSTYELRVVDSAGNTTVIS